MAWELASFPAALMGPVPELEGVDVAVVRGGDPVRITHVLDAVEPRVRPDGRPAFPVDGRAGKGRTNRLDGVVVLSCLDFPGEERPLHEQEGILYAEVDPARLAGSKWMLDVAGHYARPDVFDLTIHRAPRPMIQS